MPSSVITPLMMLLLALVVAGAVALDEPVIALPLVFMILVVWGGERVASARGRAG
ncbi:MAG: hypothetical protein QOE06_1916 [Thermoleophilaceae bacterium]|jgi:hypothetical protein|nr:hypothetical protein [Thermoleophilaceae bacterium]